MFGFLRIADLGGGTLIGGYLIVNSLGRPVEFHCTEPVRPNRAQRILFGATLDPYMYGEQIGRSLVDHSPTKPLLLVTDQQAVLALRSLIAVPLVCLNADRQLPDGHVAFDLGPNEVFLEERHEADILEIRKLYELALPNWRLEEPFERIEVAITELQKAA